MAILRRGAPSGGLRAATSPVPWEVAVHAVSPIAIVGETLTPARRAEGCHAVREGGLRAVVAAISIARPR
jgi:hypothetical protein